MERRTIVAFLVAPLVIPFIFFLPFLGTTAMDRSPLTFVEHLRGTIAWLVVLFLYVLPIAYIAELVFGVAVWQVFKRLGIRSPFAFAIAGAVMGWLVFAAISRKNLTDLSNPYFFICIVAGLVSTVLFRFVAFSGSKTENAK